NRLDEAVQHYQRVLQLDPDHFAAHNNLGNVLRDQNKMDDAIAEYRRASILKPSFEEPLVGMGDVYFKTGRLSDGETCFDKALRINPKNVIALELGARLSRAASGRGGG